MANKRSNSDMRGWGDGDEAQAQPHNDMGISDGADIGAQEHEQDTGNKRARVQPEANADASLALSSASASSSVPAAASGSTSSSSASAISATNASPVVVSMDERRALFAQFRTCQDVNELQSIMARFLRAPLTGRGVLRAWAPTFLSKLFDAPLPLSLQASILRVIASIYPTNGICPDGLDREQQGRFVDQAIAVLGRSNDPADLQTLARACRSAFATHAQLQTALPVLVATLESPTSSAEMLCDIMRLLIHMVNRTFARPLLLQFGVISSLVRRCMTHPDPQVSLRALQLIHAMLRFSQEAQPFDDALIQSGILLEGRISALLSSEEHRSTGHWDFVLGILPRLQRNHAPDVQRVVLECLPQCIRCLSASSSHLRINARSLLCFVVKDPTTPVQRAVILAAQAMQHLVRALAPDEDQTELEIIEYLSALQTVLDWEQCAVATTVLHPIAEELVRMRIVPCLDELIQTLPDPVDDLFTQLSWAVTIARFLVAHVYNRLPLGLISSQPHLGLRRQSSLTRRSCAAAQPQWFTARLEALEEQLLREEMRLQQAQAAAELAAVAEEEIGEGIAE